MPRYFEYSLLGLNAPLGYTIFSYSISLLGHGLGYAALHTIAIENIDRLHLADNVFAG